MAAKTEWLITASGQEWGPFSSSQLKQLAQQGRIVPDMLIRRIEDEKPYPAGRVDGLFSVSESPHCPPEHPRVQRQPDDGNDMETDRETANRLQESLGTIAFGPMPLPQDSGLDELGSPKNGGAPAEIALMWETAPPRMPLPPP